MVKNLYWKNTAWVDSIPIRNHSVHAVIQHCRDSIFFAKHVFHFNFANTKKEVCWRYLLKASLTSKDCEWQLTLMYSNGSPMSRSKVWYESFLWIWQTQFCVIKNHYINSRPSTFHSELMYSSFCWYKSMKYRPKIKKILTRRIHVSLIHEWMKQ